MARGHASFSAAHHRVRQAFEGRRIADLESEARLARLSGRSDAACPSNQAPLAGDVCRARSHLFGSAAARICL